jgi:hypothetical protein
MYGFKTGRCIAMGRVTNRPERITLDLSTIDNIKSFTLVYHEDEDVLFIRPEIQRPATSLDWNGEIWLRVDPNSGEVVGMEIDDFEGIFIKKYPQIATIWTEAKPLCHRKTVITDKEPRWEDFVRIVLNLLSDILRDSPHQARLGLSPP